MAFFELVDNNDLYDGSFFTHLWTTIWEFHEMLWRLPDEGEEQDPELHT